MLTYSPFNLKNLHLQNRIVMPPMCMFSSDETGLVKPFHILHYSTRSLGGVGLIIVEATAVAANGRISGNDLGIWNDSQVDGLKQIVEAVHLYGAQIGIQLAHAGRKCTSADPQIVAPSAIAFNLESRIPHALEISEIADIIEAFKSAAIRADQAGFDTVEIHAAHGYLLHEFLSPLTNQRTDAYGGTTENRTRLLREVLIAVKSVWPAEKALLLRISASDFAEGGLNLDESLKIVDLVKDHADLIHVSTGGLVETPINAYPGYQVSYADMIRKHSGLPTIAVGLITRLEQVEEILGNGRSDLVALGRELLRNPYWVINQDGRIRKADLPYPKPYERGRA
ncbi:MAG: NADPH dehydrogenase NamA [Eubacteriales bacterium]|nr:NADPH dehydrogenase NamA [Eubacteriales bacterium]